MPHRVCPWRLGHLLASPVRRWLGKDPWPLCSRRNDGARARPGNGILNHSACANGWSYWPRDRGRPSAKDDCESQAARLIERIDARVTSADTVGLGDVEGGVDFHLAVRRGARIPRGSTRIQPGRASAPRRAQRPRQGQGLSRAGGPGLLPQDSQSRIAPRSRAAKTALLTKQLGSAIL